MIGTRIKIMPGEQIIDPPIDYIRSVNAIIDKIVYKILNISIKTCRIGMVSHWIKVYALFLQ